MSVRRIGLAVSLAALLLPVAAVLATPALADSGVQIVPLTPIANRTDFYGGSVLPVKFELVDGNGNFVNTATATLWVNGDAATTRGNFNTGNTFRIVEDTIYKYNLDTSPLPAGPNSPASTITILVTLADGSTLSQSFTCTFD